MIAPRIRIVDELLQANSGLRRVLRESHPEVCFWALNGATPMKYNKKTAEGQRERVLLLRAFFPAVDAVIAHAMARFRRSEVKSDDIIDALALAISAWRGHGGYRTLPDHPPKDQVGLAMEMVFWAS
jgi:predicted RNase H-like nuclease